MPHLRPHVAALVALLGGAAAACIENIPKPSAVVASVTVAPDSCDLMEGDTLTLSATARNASHVVLPDAEIGWTSSDLGVVTVTLTGHIRGVAPGVATVTAISGSASDHAVVRVNPSVAALRISPTGLTLVPGGSFPFVADAIGTNGAVLARRAPVWTTSDSTVVRAGADGVVTGLQPGGVWLVARDGALADSVKVRAITVRFTQVSAGPYQNTCATGPQGAFCWGYDGHAGSLGAGVGVDQATAPVAVVSGSRLATVAAADAYVCALNTDAVPVCWGDGTYGRLGDGTSGGTRAQPAAVAGSHVFSALTAGRRHACGVTSAGVAYCWGGNNRGQLGVPLTTGESDVPVAVATEARFTAIGAGHMHTCGLATDSLIWCWGRGTELGDSIGINRAQPAPVYGGHKFRALTVGWTHSCGIATDGGIWCWGYNLAGELGTDADSIVKMPVSVTIAPTVTQVIAGYYATCGLTAAGQAWCWGLNNTGQLGTGDTVGGPTPRPVAVGLTFSALSIGYAHSCGVATDGILYCWGAALNGMLGDGTDVGGHLMPWPVLGQAAAPAAGPAPRAASRRPGPSARPRPARP